MKFTALEIKQQTFEKSLRGYDVNEVQSFLNVLSSEWEHMVARNKELEKEVERLNEKLKHYEKVETALHETLQSAKESSEQRLSEARKEAQNTIEKAEMEAENILRDAHRQRQQIRQGVLNLLDRREEIIRGMKSYLDMAYESLNSFARDDSSLYHLTEENQDEQAGQLSAPQTDKNAQKKQHKPAAGRDEDIDDILDEID